MALPPLPPMTLEGIRPFLTDHEYRQIRRGCTAEELPQLFSEQGISTKSDDKKFNNIRINWFRDADQRIIGVFFRVIRENHVIGWIPPAYCPFDNHQIWIRENRTQLFHSLLGDNLAPEIIAPLEGKRVDNQPIPFNIQQIDRPEEIQKFFASNPELLPANLRERVFPPEAPPVAPQPRPQENNEPTNYKLLIGSLLAFAVISYIAFKVLHKPSKAEVK